MNPLCIRKIGSLVLLVSLCFPAVMLAQTTGELTGTITDTSDAVIANATVTVRNVRTGEERVAITNDDGQYVVNALPVGEYEVEISAPGFKKIKRGGIQLNVASRTAINLRLEVGGITETVS